MINSITKKMVDVINSIRNMNVDIQERKLLYKRFKSGFFPPSGACAQKRFRQSAQDNPCQNSAQGVRRRGGCSDRPLG